jgi:hypothetical protein
MPTIQNPSMTLQPSPAGVRLTVSYSATFSAIEVFLMQNGLIVEERIHLIGDDEAVAGGAPVWTSPPEPLVLGSGEMVVARTRQFDLPRAAAQEDPTRPKYVYFNNGGVWWGGGSPQILVGYTPDDDELLARVELSYAGIDLSTLADTSMAVLSG